MSDRSRRLSGAAALAVIAVLLTPTPGEAQFWKKVKKTVENAAEAETLNQVDRMVRGKVQCVFDDEQCIGAARADGEEVVLTDDNGEILVDGDGNPVSDPDKAAGMIDEGASRPGEGAWANYDFVPGDEILVTADYLEDEVGDFPRALDLVQGTFEVVDWEGGRYLRATANGVLAIPLPETLPERFTLELSASLNHGNAYVRLVPGRAFYGPARTYRGSAISVEATQVGLRPVGGAGPMSMTKLGGAKDALRTIRVMADGEHMKMYVGEKRVANAPNAVFPRSDTLFLAVSSAAEAHPILLGPIRIAGGGRDLYDRLERDGRVATQGILFASGSARIRPESTPTLEEIGAMLAEHPDLRISIEGHTDSDGEDAFNQDLSERRAAAVKQYLEERHGVAPERLESAGFGESRPAGDNASPEGKQQNRRVELVRL